MSQTLQSLSSDLAELVQQAQATIVRVEARRRLPASGIIWSADGLIVTANHVVERDDDLRVGLPDGTVASAELVGRDTDTDIAVLRVDASSLTPATWADIDDLSVGHLVLALGRPGRTVQATLGVVSAIGGAWQTAAGGQITNYLQTDVAMYPGFSGGPLLAANGAYAGLNTSALSRGVSLTIPAATLTGIVSSLVAHGRIPKGYLGVGIQPVRLAEDIQRQLEQETGLMVMSVEADGPASKAGVLQGDILVTLDNTALRQIDDLQSLLSSRRNAASLPLRVVRSGQIQTQSVSIGQRP